MRYIAVLTMIMMSASGNTHGRTVYSADALPSTPTLEELPLRTSVTQHGITWTFDQPARIGQFVNGDYYVVSPVTVREIDPRPRLGNEVADEELDALEQRSEPRLRVRNGSMLNPPAGREVAYDSGIRNWFRPQHVTRLPIEMKPGDSLVSTISLRTGEESSFPYHSRGMRGVRDFSPVRTAAVLTCVAEPLPPDAFRPAFCDRNQTIYLSRNLRRELLLNLPVAEGAPDVASFARVFERPWVNTGFFGFDHPMENMPHYGQWVGQAVGNAALLLLSDLPAEEKEPLLINFVQVGIDYWGAVKNGHPGWEGWGGHGSGRKLPIVFAGLLLDDSTMASPTRSFPGVEFGEDNQTRYEEAWTGAQVVFAGHSGISSRTGQPPRRQWGPYEHLHPSQWDRDGQRNNQSEAYRRANTSCAWVGQALAMRLLKAEPQWGHDPFFDYVDRWMYEDDRAYREQINESFPNANLVDPSKRWFHQGYAGEDWVAEMWKRYRTMSQAPTDGWTRPRGGQ